MTNTQSSCEGFTARGDDEADMLATLNSQKPSQELAHGRYGAAGYRLVAQGTSRLVGAGTERQGSVRPGSVRFGSAGQERLGGAWSGRERYGLAGEAWPGMLGLVTSRRVHARQAWRVGARPGQARRGSHVKALHGGARLRWAGSARQGGASQVSSRQAWLVALPQGEFRHRMAGVA